MNVWNVKSLNITRTNNEFSVLSNYIIHVQELLSIHIFSCRFIFHTLFVHMITLKRQFRYEKKKLSMTDVEQDVVVVVALRLSCCDLCYCSKIAQNLFSKNVAFEHRFSWRSKFYVQFKISMVYWLTESDQLYSQRFQTNSKPPVHSIEKCEKQESFQ